MICIELVIYDYIISLYNCGKFTFRADFVLGDTINNGLFLLSVASIVLIFEVL
jgi:hypothetical protein